MDKKKTWRVYGTILGRAFGEQEGDMNDQYWEEINRITDKYFLYTTTGKEWDNKPIQDKPQIVIEYVIEPSDIHLDDADIMLMLWEALGYMPEVKEKN